MHLACARPQFLLKTESNIYSISVNLLHDNPIVKVSDLSFDLPIYTYGNCDGYLIFNNDRKGISVVCNPWLRQTKRIDQLYMDKQFTLCGIGYDSSKPEKSYKIFGYTICLNQLQQRYYLRYAMFELETNAWKLIDHVQHLQETSTEVSFPWNNVSLNGNVYWTAFDQETRKYFIRILDFSKEIIKPFCIIPGEKKDSAHPYALAVYKGDRFSFLEQCHFTRKIDIWVTKKNISNGDDGDAVVWIKFMTVSIPNFPVYDQYRSSCYLVDNNIYGKTFVMCCSDGRNRQASVYVVIGGLCKRIKIDDVVAWFYRFSVYVPSLIPITLDEEN